MTSSQSEFWVIGVGASAGGLEALSAFFRSLRPKPNAAIIVAQHLAPHAKSMMVELIGRQTKMEVIPVVDHLPLRPGLLCIVPPNYDVTVENNELRLFPAGVETRPKPSVDLLFSSLAQTYGKRAVGIILSGTGTDGSEGIRAIKESGGVTIVQDTVSAKYDGMPKSAFETGLVDAVLPPEQIADKLFTILDHREPEIMPKVEIDPGADEFENILKHLKKELGTDFTQYKTSTIQRRLEKRLSGLQIKTLAEYHKYLLANPAELSHLAQNMLISVTQFLRDPEAFREIEHCLEEIIAKKQEHDELRIWTAGCATGEESYTFAFIVSDICLRLRRFLAVKIFATDLDQEALVHARTGLYSADEVTALPEEMIGKYFERRDERFEVKKSIRDLIVFARQDLIQNPPFVKLDLVSCRNVLIYFDNSLQGRVFDIFHYALRPNGVLFLGKSENAPAALFEAVDKKMKIFRRLNSTATGSYYPSTKYKVPPSTLTQPLRRRQEEGRTITESVSTELLKMARMAGALVDEEGSIVQLIGDASDYVSFPSGVADFRLTNLLPKVATVEFSILLKRSQKELKAQRSRVYKQESSPKKSFRFTVKPFDLEGDNKRPLFLVLFESRKIQNLLEARPADVPYAGRIAELEQEVAATKESLQTVIEELEVSNEELQSLNEELSSTNEELQASNEELETTNEELQSTNEELLTLNEELNSKSIELRNAYTSLENIQSSITSPLIVIDLKMRIVRFNANSNQVFNLSTNDIGTPITRASCQCEIPEFEQNIQKTMTTGKTVEVLCETPKRVFQMRIHPNIDERGETIGAIVVFFDNTEFIRAQEKLKSSDRRIRAIIDSSPTLISLKDNLGRYLIINQSFMRYFGLKEDEILGKTDREIFPEAFSNDLRENDLEVLLKRRATEKEESIRYQDKDSTFLSNRFPLFGPTDRHPYAIGTVSLDITEQKRAQRKLEESEVRYRAIIEDQAVFVCRHGKDGEIYFSNSMYQSFFRDEKNFFNLVENSDRERVLEILSKISPGQPIVQYEHKALLAQGARWVRWIHRGIFDSASALIEYQAVGFDVTDFHNQTRDLLVKESLYTNVLDHTSDYLTVYRQQGQDFILESFNQSAAKYRGFDQTHLIGRSLTSLLETDLLKDILPKFKKASATGEIMNYEETIEGPGGTMYLSTTIVPIIDHDQNQRRIVALSRDITKLKRTEKALRTEKIKAESANLAKTEFLASMSHELRTPLNVIMGMSQLLNRADIRPEHKKLVESIQRSSKILLALIEDVLDLSKIEAGKISFSPTSTNLDLLISDVIGAFETPAKLKGISLLCRKNFSKDLMLVVDPTRLKQVLINLVNNAIKFTAKGSVTLNVEVDTETEDEATLFFEVLDTGIGIAPDNFPKIFQRFSQADSSTSRKYGGTGLGLAISKQLVELMNGSIGFESNVGEGSVFWFKICLKKARDVGQNLSISTDNFSFKTLRTLAVDDNPDALKVLKLLFEDDRASLKTVDNATDSLEILQKEKFDLVLMDMQMPKVDGLEATRKIRREDGPNKDVKIIALTANAMSGDRERCLEAGMNEYLTKPVDFNLLKLMVLKMGLHDSNS